MGHEVRLPDRLKCSIGGEWKPLAGFSNKNIELARRMLQTGNNVAIAAVKCREHSGATLDEMQCEGPCHKVRPLDQFSKSSRRNNINKCIECTAWAGTCEPGYIPFAAPNNQVAYDEAARGHRIPDIPDEFYDSHDKLLAPNTEGSDVANLSSLGASDFIGVNYPADPGSYASASAGFGSGKAQLSTVKSGNKAAASESTRTDRNWTPPHLSKKSASIATNPSSISTATTVREEREKNERVYHYYDSSGRLHRQANASGTIESETSSRNMTNVVSLEPVTTTATSQPSNRRKFPKTPRLPVDYRKEGSFKFDMRDPDPDMDDWDSPDEL